METASTWPSKGHPSEELDVDRPPTELTDSTKRDNEPKLDGFIFQKSRSDLEERSAWTRQLPKLSDSIDGTRTSLSVLCLQQEQEEVLPLCDDDDDVDVDDEETTELLRQKLQEVDYSHLQQERQDECGDDFVIGGEHRIDTDNFQSVDDERLKLDQTLVLSEDSEVVAFWKAKCDRLSTALIKERQQKDQKVTETMKSSSLTPTEHCLTFDDTTIKMSGDEETDLRDQVTILTNACEDLEREKVALSEELDRMKNDLEQDNRTDDKKELETLQTRVRVLEDQVTNMSAENDSLSISLEELDAQHQLAIGQVLASREEIQNKYSNLAQKGLNKCQEPEKSLDQILDWLVDPSVIQGNDVLTMKLSHLLGVIKGLIGFLDDDDDLIKLEKIKEETKLQVDLSEQKVVILASRNDELELNVGALQTRIKQLEEFLVDKERQVNGLTDILRVYKENLDPDEEAEKRKHMSEVLEYKEKIKQLEVEHDGMISVLDDKTRENSNLKVEVHRLLNAVSTDRLAMAKQRLDSEVESEDMTKEALKNLAHLVRDREAEIVALKQKNESLVCLFKETNEGNKVAMSLEKLSVERDQLNMTVIQLQGEREQIVSALNQKHGESLAYHAEIQRMAAVIEELNSNGEQLAEKYERQMLDAQTEVIAKEDTKHNEIDQNSENVINKMSDDYAGVTKEIDRLTRCVQDKDKLLYEKDRQLHEKMRQIQGVQELLQRKEENMGTAKQHSEKLSEQLNGLRQEVDSFRANNNHLRSQMEELRSSVATLKEANSMLNVTLQEREFELKALREKENTLSRMIMKKETDDDQDLRRLLSESEQMRQRAQGFQAERDQVALTLAQKQRDADELREQIKGPIKEREERLLKELERLRSHLLHVEDNYTQEALRAEDREKELRNRLALAEERFHTASSSRNMATHHASLQAESLQEQLRAVVEQRDEVLVSLSTVEDQLAQKATALHTLQVVLEQLQQERQRDLSTLQTRHLSQMTIEQIKQEKLQQEIHSLMERQKETTEALGAASRLTEQLDRKEEIIRQLKEEVGRRDLELEKTKQEIVRMNSSSETTVGRTIIKNLVIGLLTVPQNQRKEVLRVIATILDFNKEEREKTGLDDEVKFRTPSTPATSGWISSWMHGNKSSAQQRPDAANQSLTEAFVRFLERESQPANSPSTKTDSKSDQSLKSMVHPHHSTQRTPRVNPFNYPMMINNQKRGIDLSSTTNSSSHLLLKPMSTALPTFATSVPVATVSENATFLREALQNQ